jgi:hypothetical protein
MLTHPCGREGRQRLAVNVTPRLEWLSPEEVAVLAEKRKQ